MSNYIWLVPFLPLLAVGINGLFGKRVLGKNSGYVASVLVGGAWILSVITFLAVVSGQRLNSDLYMWIPAGDFQVTIGFLVDPLSAVMLIVVTTVSLLVHIYSIGYMHGDPGFYRFFTYLPLFTFSMLMLVLANNYLELYVFWEAVGLCSYLLIGFWYTKKSASDAAKKAFIVNRVGDFGFGLGVLLIFLTFGTLAYADVFGAVEGIPAITALAISLLLFMGAMGKSSQVPLHTWLPDAMEGPSPVSALIHAATMVTAGVYMVARSMPIYETVPEALLVVAVIGTLTAFFGATAALVNNDIKRIMAYSTISQLGYMFFALGVGAWVAAIFHLMTHAFFKALLFLGAGSVMHGTGGETDIQKMGGLGKHLPVTRTTLIIAAAALAGIFPLAGFWSKDEIIGAAFLRQYYVVFAVGILVAFMTAFYSFRMIFLTFYGPERYQQHGIHPHESPKVMTIPLVILAILTVVAGFAGVPPEAGFIQHLLEQVGGVAHAEAAAAVGFTGTTIILMIVSTLVAVGGILLAWAMYLSRINVFDPEAWGRTFRGAYVFFYNKWYFDELYDFVFVRTTLALGRAMWWIDANIIDGAVNGLASLVSASSGGLRRVQTGFVQNYAFVMLLGILTMISVYLFVALRS